MERDARKDGAHCISATSERGSPTKPIEYDNETSSIIEGGSPTDAKRNKVDRVVVFLMLKLGVCCTKNGMCERFRAMISA